VSDVTDGIDRACASIDSGAARDVLARTVETSRRAAARMEL
jgi:anthranilate phosphoribosyltransferase